LSFGFAADYVLAAGDTLEIKIINHKDLDTKQTITPDGTISLPLLGRIKAEGLTMSALDQYLSTEFSKYLEKPQVVTYLTPRPIYVIQHDVKKNVWEVKEAKSVTEAKALECAKKI
jgi:protein involved in polysaccharide export with SLBB domain